MIWAQVALGLALGVGVGLANAALLRRSVRSALAASSAGRRAGLMAAGFALRYALIGATAYFLVKTGLAIVAFNAMLAAGCLSVYMACKREERGGGESGHD